MTKLRQGIVDQVTAVVPHALHGLGGVGKTQMAVEYVYRYREHYDLVWWIPADQPHLVRNTLAGLAKPLGLSPMTATGVEDAANAVLDALRRGDPYDRWLLVFDNADQPEDLTEVYPADGPGHVLITSRNHRWQGVVDTVPIDVFTPEESLQFLAKRVPGTRNNPDSGRLAEELGYLPLALEQAGALQVETGMPVSQYLDLLTRRTTQLMSEGKPSEYPLSMTAAWSLSVVTLGDTMPEAVELLRYCAFFSPEPIPRDVFNQEHSELGVEISRLLSDPIRLSKAIGELGRYALAKVDIPGRTIQVHRLIQALVREEVFANQRESIQHEVFLMLAKFAQVPPEDRTSWPRYYDLLAHIQPDEVAESRTPEIRDLVLKIVRYLRASGAFESAKLFLEQLLKTWSQDGPESELDVLRAQRHMANVLRELGEYKKAYTLSRQTLSRMESAAGAQHEETLLLVNQIGADLRAAGEFQAARVHDLDSLTRHTAVFSAGDPATLRVVNSLGLDCGLNSDYQQAKQYHEQAYRGQLRMNREVGAVGVLASLSGLARAVRLCGDYAEASDLGAEAHAYGVEELGAEHHWTLRTAKDLSIAWRRVGEFEQALELALEVHSKFVRLYGLNHPDTLASAMCLANVQRSIGDIEAAMKLATDTVRRYPGVYGPEHPYNHGCSGNLALLLRVSGEPETARLRDEDALAGLEAKLGRDHHYSLTVAVNLASDLAALEDLTSAVRLGTGTHRRLKAVLGPEHPMTLACAANLSTNLFALDRKDEAKDLHEETLAVYARTLGTEHPDAVVAQSGRPLDCDFDPPPI